MPLEPPNLDRHTFDELYEQARARIPRYTPEWTDFNDSDPGITLLQLYAWLTEQMLYEMNRVPERTYIKVLQMLGFERRPAQPAVAHLTFAPDPTAPGFPPVEAGTAVAGQAADGSQVLFETVEGFDPVRMPLAALQVSDGGAFTDLSTANESENTPFRPLGWVPRPGNALYLGFTPPEQPVTGRVFPDELRLRVFLPPPAPGTRPPVTTPQVEIVWEYAAAARPTRWRELNTYLDGSGGFTREGDVRVEGPSRPVATGEGKLAGDRYWIRARLAGGAYPAGGAPEIDFVRCNTIAARNLTTVRNEILGTGDGRPGQALTLASAPVLPESLTIEIEPDGVWERADDLYASGPADKHFVLTAATGLIVFGDGAKGLIPPGGARIVATRYQHGGGENGNLAAGRITAPQTSLPGVESVTNVRAATGGRDEQPAEDLIDAAPRMLRNRERAVSAEDFATLAEDIGGVRRAVAVPLAHPRHPGVEVPGAVTVVVVPEEGGVPPVPTPDLLAVVRQRLDPARLITTELHVTGPHYLRVSVSAAVRADPTVAGGTVQRLVLAALGTHLDPVKRGFGADLVPSLLYGVLQSVPEVRDVTSLSIEVQGRRREVTEQIVAGPGELFYGEGHQITVQPFRDR
ncbi:putative baseplate assembly protein [Actinoplanes sp. NPDC051861]|uniref:putative baseplate assembly protein n=1 Tax=Actinoplanes sp. NPDC051861 TaxID=3155170 RepID=UPI00344983EC